MLALRIARIPFRFVYRLFVRLNQKLRAHAHPKPTRR